MVSSTKESDILNKKADLYRGKELKRLYPMCFLPGKDFYELHVPQKENLEIFFLESEKFENMNLENLLASLKNEKYQDKKPQYISDFKSDIPEIIKKARTYIISLINFHELSEKVDLEKTILFCMYGAQNPYTFPRIFDYDLAKEELEKMSKPEILKKIYVDILARKFIIQNPLLKNILKKSTLEWYLEDLLTISNLSLHVLKNG